jgi:hypothetical protein
MDIGRPVEWIKISPRHLLPLSPFIQKDSKVPRHSIKEMCNGYSRITTRALVSSRSYNNRENNI